MTNSKIKVSWGENPKVIAVFEVSLRLKTCISHLKKNFSNFWNSQVITPFLAFFTNDIRSGCALNTSRLCLIYVWNWGFLWNFSWQYQSMCYKYIHYIRTSPTTTVGLTLQLLCVRTYRQTPWHVFGDRLDLDFGLLWILVGSYVHVSYVSRIKRACMQSGFFLAVPAAC